MENGVLFDIQRGCTNDGPGLRTTVFLKGCPLHCLWCHNPESQATKPDLLFNFEKCVLCGKCAAVCPCHVIMDGKHSIKRENCVACGKCTQVCPAGALEIKGMVCSVDKVMHEVLKDLKYYQKSGGGVTISGGEPCQQPEFLKEILRSCREHDIHTAVETSGFTTEKTLESILPLTDLFLWDYKVSRDSETFIGADSGIILRNLDYMIRQGANTRLRCPIIPGVNDNLLHLSAIAELSRRYPLQGVDILPYHNMGVFKSKKLGRKPWDEGLPNMSEETKQWISDVLTEKKCRNFQIQ